MKRIPTLKIVLGVFFLACWFTSTSQTFNMTNGQTSTTCSGTFYDSGGQGGNYGNNENIVHTFCPDNPGECLWFEFESFNTQQEGGLFGSTEDILTVYDGPSTASPQITTLSGDFGNVDFPIGSSNGCITFEFQSTNNTNFAGWEAMISCTPCPVNQLTTHQDCIGAVRICQDHLYNPYQYFNAGNFPGELNSANNCLVDEEDNSSWYIFQVGQTGTLRFILHPLLNENFDWSIFDISNHRCSDIFPGIAPTLACNSANSLGGFPPIVQDGGRTGANSLAPYNGTGNNTDVNGSPYSADIPVTAGQVLVMVVTSPTSAAGFYLDFSDSTPGIFDDNIIPQIIDIEPVACGDDEVNITFDDHIDCANMNESDWSVIGPGGPYTIDDVWSQACTSPGFGNNSEKYFRIEVSPPFTIQGTYTLVMDGNVFDICGNLIPDFTIDFEVGGPTEADAGNNISFCEGDVAAQTLGGSPTAPQGGTVTWTSDPPGATGFITTSLNDPNPSLDVGAMTEGVYTYFVEVDNAGCTALDTVVVNVADCSCDLTVNATGQELDCVGDADGVINTTVSGGMMPYTYNWTNGVPNVANPGGLNSGNYQVTVTSADGCIGTAAADITEPSALLITGFTFNSPTCGDNNGSISITSVSGGSTPYTYDFGSGQMPGSTESGLAPGNYEVTVFDNNGCETTQSFNLTDIPAPTLNASPTDASACGTCDGTVDLTVTGGSSPFTFNWESASNPGVSIGTTEDLSGLCGGNYCVTVTDANNCVSTALCHRQRARRPIHYQCGYHS